MKLKIFISIILFFLGIAYINATDLHNDYSTFKCDYPYGSAYTLNKVGTTGYFYTAPEFKLSGWPFSPWGEVGVLCGLNYGGTWTIDNSVGKLYSSELNIYFCVYNGVGTYGTLYGPVNKTYICPGVIYSDYWARNFDLQNYGGLDGGGQPPLYPTNQPKPEEYFKNVDSEYNENIGKGNCLYTNPNTTVYEKPLQYCKASDFSELGYSYTNRYCENGYNAYINARIGGIDNFFIRSLVCANCNNESCIGNVKTNDSTYLNLQPFLTFGSILNFYYTGGVNTYGLQTGALSVEGVMQTYPEGFMNHANDSLIYGYIIPTDIVRQTYPNVGVNSSPINYDISQTSTNSNGIEFKYYLDLNFEVCRTWHYLTCPLNQGLFSELKDYPAAKSDLFTTYKQYAYKLYDTGITLPEIYETNPPEIINPSPSVSPNPDNNIYKCELSGLEWYQYLGGVVGCISNTAVGTYNKGVNFIQNVGGYFKKFLDIGSDRTPTKTFGFFIDSANAQTGDFTDIMGGVTKGITRTGGNNYNFFSNFMGFAEKSVYAFVFVLIVSTFLFLYFKK